MAKGKSSGMEIGLDKKKMGYWGRRASFFLLKDFN
jgi:hypothetical protein